MASPVTPPSPSLPEMMNVFTPAEKQMIQILLTPGRALFSVQNDRPL